MQCVRAFVAQQPDELSLEKADVLLVLQRSIDGEKIHICTASLSNHDDVQIFTSAYITIMMSYRTIVLGRVLKLVVWTTNYILYLYDQSE